MMDMIALYTGWFFNFIPWWAWLVAALVAAALTVQFWAPIWAVMPSWMKAALIFIGAVLLAFIAGRNRGSKDERDVRKEADAHAVERRKDIDHEVANIDRPAADKRLDRWMRD
jgi:hypothetical protein